MSTNYLLYADNSVRIFCSVLLSSTKLICPWWESSQICRLTILATKSNDRGTWKPMTFSSTFPNRYLFTVSAQTLNSVSQPQRCSLTWRTPQWLHCCERDFNLRNKCSAPSPCTMCCDFTSSCIIGSTQRLAQRSSIYTYVWWLHTTPEMPEWWQADLYISPCPLQLNMSILFEAIQVARGVIIIWAI